MSILNAFVMPNVAILGFDTEAMLPGNAYRPDTTKIIFLPHLSAAVGFRGVAITMAVALAEISIFLGSFDELASNMPGLVKHSLEITKERAERSLWDHSPEQIESANYVLVGYSESADRMVGHAYATEPNSSEIQVFNDVPRVIAPSVLTKDEIAALGIDLDRAGMEKLAMEQCRLGREQLLNEFCGGGRFFIAEIGKGRTTIDEVCHFPPR